MSTCSRVSGRRSAVTEGLGLASHPQRAGATGRRRAPVVVRASVIDKIHREIKTGNKTALDVTNAYLEQLKANEPQIQSFITFDEDYAREQVPTSS